MTVPKKYKTRDELEDEDHARYLEHQEETFRRRIKKRAEEGYKCPFDGCSSIFDNIGDLVQHKNEHKKECFEKMICSQHGCGKQFKKKPEFLKHIEGHRQEALKKIKSDIRSVLILQQYGILADEFNKEFRKLVGKIVPYSVIGIPEPNPLELANSFPDVVKLVKLNHGQVFMQAVPDENTSDLADAIQNQEWRRGDGFNRATGEALRSREDRDVLANANSDVSEKTRKVPLYIMNLLRDLIEEEEFPEEGLSFEDFRDLYDMEVGHTLDVTDFGFKNMEDFYINGDFQGLVEPRLAGLDKWILLPCNNVVQSDENRSPDKYRETLRSIKENLKRLFDEKVPYGCSRARLVELYEAMFGFDQATLLSKDLLQVCLLFPDICTIDRYGYPHCDLTIVPANGNTKHPFIRPIFPLFKLCETKTRVKYFLDHIGKEVEFKKFVDGVEGYFGHMNLLELRCDNWLDVLKMMPDICTIEKKLQAKGGYVISLATSAKDCPMVKTNSPKKKVDTPEIPSQLITNLHKVLAVSPSGIKHTEIYSKYVKVVGESLDLSKFETKSLSSLLRNLHGRYGFKFNGSVLMCSLKVINLPPLQLKDSLPCWVQLVEVCGDGTFKLKEVNSQETWDLEDKLENFYVTKGNGIKMSEEDCVVGQLVCAVFKDARCYRARIEAVHEDGFVTLSFLDMGQVAMLPSHRLFQLDDQFSVVPQQVFTVHNVLSNSSKMRTGDYFFLSERNGQLVLSPSKIEAQGVTATATTPSIKATVKSMILKKIASNIA